MEEQLTAVWNKFQKCKSYIEKKQLVSKTKENWNFYLGDQWEGIDADGERLPVLNFIEAVIKYKVAVVSQNVMTATFSDINSNQDFAELCEALNKSFSESWEKAKMDDVLWEVTEAGAVQGDSYAYWGDGDTKKPPKILPNTCVLLGDENEKDLQKQPFILIYERLNVEHVKSIAKQNGISKEDIELITSDDNKELIATNKDEVEGKVGSVIMLSKNTDGFVEITRSTKHVVYEPTRELRHMRAETGEKLGSGQKMYPLVNFVWKRVPNNARGVSEVAQLIPNQIAVNKTIARRAITVKLTAYPRIAYNSAALQNPEDLDKVGAPLEVNGGAESVNQMISYLNATNISQDAEKLQDALITLTRELAGAGDYATGNVNPEQASGQAILAVRDNAQTPLNRQVAVRSQFVEDVALLWFDLWTAFSIDNSGNFEIDGEIYPMEFVQELIPSIKIDVSQDDTWTKTAEQQWIDAIYQKGDMTLEEYVEVSNSNIIPKGRFQSMLAKRQQMIGQMPQDMEMPEEMEEPQAEPIPEELTSGPPEQQPATGSYYDRIPL